MPKSVRWLVVVVAVVLTAAACSSSPEVAVDPTVGTTTTTATAAEAEPDVNDGPSAGDLLEASALDVEGVEASAVRYLSTGVDGELVEVTGMVLVPEGLPEGGPSAADVISWGHGTTGVADECAPSADPAMIPGSLIMLAQAGYVVALTDYEGLGTDGTHPYLVGESEARSAIDIVRAVRQLDYGVGDRYAVAGLSQGGHAALWAGELTVDYAPELELVGVVAAAPASGLGNLMQTVGTPAQGFAVMAAVAFDARYDDVALADYFNPAAIEIMEVVNTGCNTAVFAAFLTQSFDDMVEPSGWDGNQPIGPLAERLAENDPGQADIDAPVLLVQGDVDAIVDRTLVEAVQESYCEGATNAEYRLYPGGGHGDTIITAMDEVLAWLDDRFAGVEAVDGCATVDPDLAALLEAEQTEAAVDGVLLEGATPEGYDTLTNDTTAPQFETCPGTPIFGGGTPLAYSASTWQVAPVVGPFLDVWVARFDSPDEAAAAIAALDAELIDCGEFVDPATTARGSFSRADSPGLGDDSYTHEFTGNLAGIPVGRFMATVQVGDIVYGSAQSQAFGAARSDVALEAMAVLLSLLP